MWTPSRRLRGWREPLWHEPDWVPGSISVPNTGHYQRLYVDLTSGAQHVSSVAEHGTNALPNRIFSYFYSRGRLSQASGFDSPFNVKSFEKTKSSWPASVTKEAVGAF